VLVRITPSLIHAGVQCLLDQDRGPDTDSKPLLSASFCYQTVSSLLALGKAVAENVTLVVRLTADTRNE
jgi:hypothetical protein